VSAIKVGMREDIAGQHGERVRKALLDALDNPPATDPDENGTFEVTVEADDIEAALLKVWNAVAASGVDDHICFIEHPDMPEHWRRVPR
jgi:hypothetical protein